MTHHLDCPFPHADCACGADYAQPFDIGRITVIISENCQGAKHSLSGFILDAEWCDHAEGYRIGPHLIEVDGTSGNSRQEIVGNLKTVLRNANLTGTMRLRTN